MLFFLAATVRRGQPVPLIRTMCASGPKSGPHFWDHPMLFFLSSASFGADNRVHFPHDALDAITPTRAAAPWSLQSLAGRTQSRRRIT